MLNISGDFDPETLGIEYLPTKPKRARSPHRESPWKKWLRNLEQGTTAVIDARKVYPEVKDTKLLRAKTDQLRSNILYNAKRTEYKFEIWQSNGVIYVHKRRD